MSHGRTSLLPASGRPGTGTGTELVPTAQPVGYEPRELDRALQEHISLATSFAEKARRLSAKVEEALKNLESHQLAGGNDLATAFAEANRLTILEDRATKSLLNLIKSTDELSRLRSFVAGGPDRRADLSVKGEVELRALVLTGIRALGWRVYDHAGAEIVAEAA